MVLLSYRSGSRPASWLADISIQKGVQRVPPMLNRTSAEANERVPRMVPFSTPAPRLHAAPEFPTVRLRDCHLGNQSDENPCEHRFMECSPYPSLGGGMNHPSSPHLRVKRPRLTQRRLPYCRQVAAVVHKIRMVHGKLLVLLCFRDLVVLATRWWVPEFFDEKCLGWKIRSRARSLGALRGHTHRVLPLGVHSTVRSR